MTDLRPVLGNQCFSKSAFYFCQ